MEDKQKAHRSKLNEKTLVSQVALPARRLLVKTKLPFRVSLLKSTELMSKCEEF